MHFSLLQQKRLNDDREEMNCSFKILRYFSLVTGANKIALKRSVKC